MSEAIQRFDYAGVVGDIEYVESTYVRYEDHLSAMDNMMKNITGNIVDKAWDLGWNEGLIEAIKVIEDLKNKPGAHEEHYITAIKLLRRYSE